LQKHNAPSNIRENVYPSKDRSLDPEANRNGYANEVLKWRAGKFECQQVFRSELPLMDGMQRVVTGNVTIGRDVYIMIRAQHCVW
jgi:hypothetical protein